MRKRSKKARRCMSFPTVWAAINGCEGMTRMWRPCNIDGHVFECDTCHAKREETKGLRNAELQAVLIRRQAEAGVDNYRTEPARWVDGRPRLLKDVEVER